MKTRLLIIIVIVLSSIFLIGMQINHSLENPTREDLKEVVHASNSCSQYWRGELFEMWGNKTHDYKNDPIFQECLEWLEFEKYTNTSYGSDRKQLKNILEHCIDSKDLIETKGLSYSNDTHYIDTVSCEWKTTGEELERLWEIRK